jgi:hypothetical protein
VGLDLGNKEVKCRLHFLFISSSLERYNYNEEREDLIVPAFLV